MKTATKDYIINTVFRTNILPITSRCNTNCVFCSHKQNPEGIEVFKMPELSLEDFKEVVHYLSPDSKIIIGESATRIIEGEPLLYDRFLELLEFIRLKYKHTPIQITTNGILLERGLIDRLDALGDIELNISVNGISPEQRSRILGLKHDDHILEKLDMLKDRISFSGSFVLVPDLLGEEDIKEILLALNDKGAKSVRVFLPGYTKLAGRQDHYEEIYAWAEQLIAPLKKNFDIPIIIEPSIIKDLDCKIEGVIRQSPAWKAGIKTGDVIRTVNGTEVGSRVNGFNRIFSLQNPMLTLDREGIQIELKLEKPRNSSPGFAVLYDIDLDISRLVHKTAARHKAKNILFMTSELALGILTCALEKRANKFNHEIIAVENIFFGGTIKAAGLLTSVDITRAWKEYLKAGNGTRRPDLVVLPPVMFDFKMDDLLGVNIKEIEENLGIPVDTV